MQGSSGTARSLVPFSVRATQLCVNDVINANEFHLAFNVGCVEQVSSFVCLPDFSFVAPPEAHTSSPRDANTYALGGSTSPDHQAGAYYDSLVIAGLSIGAAFIVGTIEFLGAYSSRFLLVGKSMHTTGRRLKRG